MKRIRIIGFFMLLPLLLTAAKESSSDSLAQLLDKTEGQAKISLLIQLSEQNRDKSVYDCKEYFNKAFSLARKLNDKNMMGLASKSMGVSYFYWGDMKKAFQYFKKGLEIMNKAATKKGNPIV